MTPEKIYLTKEYEDEPEDKNYLWCQDNVNDDDVQYIRKDIMDKAVKDVGIACVRKTGEAYKNGYEDARIEVREECAKIAEDKKLSCPHVPCGEVVNRIAKAIRG